MFLTVYFGFDVAIAYIKNDYVIDQMKNLTIPCGEKPLEHSPAMWVREGKKEHHLQEIQVSYSITILWNNFYHKFQPLRKFPI